MPSLDYYLAAVRSEVAKYHDGEFSDTADLTADLALLSDDLTAIASDLEDGLGITLNRNEYRNITTVESWARALQKAAG